MTQRNFQFSIFNFLILIAIFGLALPNKAWAAELYFSPQNQTVRQDENFTVEVWLDTQDQDINAIEANLFFSQGKMELVDISRGGSLLELWLSEPNFSNETKNSGKISGS